MKAGCFRPVLLGTGVGSLCAGSRARSLPSRAPGNGGADGMKGAGREVLSPAPGVLASGRGEGTSLSLSLHGRVGPGFQGSLLGDQGRPV